MPFFFGALSKVWKQGRRGSQTGASMQDASTPNDPHRYAVTVCSNEVALGRFIKRLSVSGAEHIKVEYAGNGVVHVRMKRPAHASNWEGTVSRLVDQCRLRCVSASARESIDLFGQE